MLVRKIVDVGYKLEFSYESYLTKEKENIQFQSLAKDKETSINWEFLEMSQRSNHDRYFNYSGIKDQAMLAFKNQN